MTDKQPYALDDPSVLALGKFLANTPLSSGGFAPLPPPINVHVAQAVANWTQGLVWAAESNSWIPRATYEADPELGDIEIETIADGQVVKMTHRVTGITALGESHDQAWQELRRKVRATNG